MFMPCAVGVRHNRGATDRKFGPADRQNTEARITKI